MNFSGKSAIVNIRKLKEVNHFIYISSNLRPPVKNFLDLASMEGKSGFEGLDPFVVKQIIPLDLAPHTLRCDLVILCDRLKADEIPKANRPTPKAEKTTVKNNSIQKKMWHNSASSGRSNFFPTEEMVRRYSNIRKPKQEIDYQKRDSLYPLPLRGALYQGSESEMSSYYPNDRYSQHGHHHSVPNYLNKTAIRNDGDLGRFTDFRRDMECALDDTSYFSRGKQLTSRKLAYANALLEEGIRLASEVLNTDYTRMPLTTGLHGRPKIPNSSNKYRY